MAKFLQVGSIKLAKDKKDESGNIIKKGQLYINLNQTQNKNGVYTSENLKDLYVALGKFIENPEKNGLNLQIDKPQNKIKRLADLGYIEEGDVEGRLASIPEYIKYEIAYIKED